MKKLLSLIILIGTFFTVRTAANELDFSIKPILAENQTFSDSAVSVKYVTEKALTFELTNISDKTLEIHVKSSSPSLDTNGNLVFFDKLTFLETPKTVKLSAKETKKVTINFIEDAFKADFDGEITDQLLFIQKDTEYYYDFTINVRKNDNKVAENVKLIKTEATTIDKKRAIKLTFKNDSNAWLLGVQITTQLEEIDNNKSASHNYDKIAPNSKIEIIVPIKQKFKAGNYTVKNVITSDDKSWQLDGQLELTKKQANVLNGYHFLPDTSKDTWIIPSLVGLFAILLVGIVIQVKLSHRKPSHS
ncbi:hypothetical protein Hs30E_01490 [Lactococcus hodotermopsidis]|uniref:WxL Interacting Protein host binding domain-containing protein n=1 Tax=Pseudolactococcus hodotermopsidis TaxID=2709157 RepID=A0A6A0BAW0_9LACT|nr:DUF3324 domain-containing protein [Lactococcus hodotermopsidis]GFH41598.1 hypothetical protein Hs30E_01490 [Lactococcus hodotermopsidis]